MRQPRNRLGSWSNSILVYTNPVAIAPFVQNYPSIAGRIGFRTKASLRTRGMHRMAHWRPAHKLLRQTVFVFTPFASAKVAPAHPAAEWRR